MASSPEQRPVPKAMNQPESVNPTPDGRPANRPAAPQPANRAAPAKPAAAHTAAAGQAPGEQEDFEEYEGGSANFLLFNAMPSVLTSMIFHAVALVIMSLMFVVIEEPRLVSEFTMGPDENEEVEEIEEIEEVEFEELDVETETFEATDLAPVETEIETPEPDVSPANDLEAAAVTVPEFNPLGDTAVPTSDMLNTVGAFTGSALEGRGSAEGRKRLAKAAGGNDASEAAVQRALKWIASRQAADGGWNFNHNHRLINAPPCPDPGSAEQARNGATGLALLPFLGAGQTHKEGMYKKQVYAGLAYLIKNMKVQNNTGSWHEPQGSMYSHGICAIAMCEAYAMTHDKELLAPAQLSLNFIVYAQDPVGGGWRYKPKQAGDTSAVGWQLMALKSGHMAYLQVPKGTILGAMKFLDSVQSDSGAKYGYTGPGAGQATTAVGLLSRMYLGWKHDNPALQRGVEFLSNKGPSKSANMYYNYYATQVCRHYEGEVWEKWNNEMRDWLVAEQEKDGVKAGSWYWRGGDHGSERGGRLYCTSMATMMLEVYYRHLPIYRKQASDEEFAL